MIVFDEAEKAHPKIWQSLLTFFDEGIVTEADGTRYDATGCILIATSNLGYREAIDTTTRCSIRPPTCCSAQRPQIEEFSWKHVSRYFSPEFLGRFGRENVILFNHFDLPAYRSIVDAQVDGFSSDMARRGLTVAVPDEVRQRLAAMAWENRREGARTVRRLIDVNLRETTWSSAFFPTLPRPEIGFALREDGSIDVSVR